MITEKSFYLKFKEAEITHPSHFDHVTEKYLSDLGLSIPAQRRLRDAVKKEKKKDKKYKKKVWLKTKIASQYFLMIF